MLGSNLKPLKKPEFSSQIPHHLLHDLGEKDREILNQLSTQTQQNQWIIETLIGMDEQVRKTNGRVNALEEKATDCLTKTQVRSVFFGKWGILTLAIGVIFPVIITLVSQWLKTIIFS